MRRLIHKFGIRSLPAMLLCAGCSADDLTQPPDSTPPAAPTQLVARASSATEIDLEWRDNSGDEHGFEVWRSSGPDGSFGRLIALEASVTAYSNTDLPAGEPFCYRVRAFGVSGAPPSEFSTSACATTPVPTAPAPQVPSGLTAAAASGSEIDLAWADNSSDEAGFEVWQSTSGATGAFNLLASLPAGTAAYANTGLEGGTQYCYKVRASGAAGAPPSGFTAVACATTETAPLAAPTGLTATAASTSQINLAWVDNASGESQYEVWRSTSGSGGSFSAYAFLAADRTTYSDVGLNAGTEYCYKVKAVAPGRSSSFAGPDCATTQQGQAAAVRITTYGDSNTDTCNGDGSPEIASYVSRVPRLAPNDPNLSCQVAGKVEAKWAAGHSNTITAINHAITGSTTGGGGFGGPDRTGLGAPNSRLSRNGVTRFEAEILGLGYIWNGGEPTNSFYPSGPVSRVRAYTPGANDFAYVSIGTNDPFVGISTSQTIANLTWMIDRWTGAGHAANHFIITTLAPRTDDNYGSYIPTVNTAIRSLAASRGVRLIDLCDHVSNDNCLTWASATYHIGDGVHYTQTVRGWIADQIVAIMSPLIASN